MTTAGTSTGFKASLAAEFRALQRRIGDEYEATVAHEATIGFRTTLATELRILQQRIGDEHDVVVSHVAASCSEASSQVAAELQNENAKLKQGMSLLHENLRKLHNRSITTSHIVKRELQQVRKFESWRSEALNAVNAGEMPETSEVMSSWSLTPCEGLESPARELALFSPSLTALPASDGNLPGTGEKRVAELAVAECKRAEADLHVVQDLELSPLKPLPKQVCSSQPCGQAQSTPKVVKRVSFSVASDSGDNEKPVSSEDCTSRKLDIDPALA